MTPSNRWLYLGVAALLAAALVLQVIRDRGWQPYEPPSGVMWIRSGPLADRLALGFDNLAADVYWIRAVVYFGSQRLAERNRNFDQLFPLLDLVTSLDPFFSVAYRFGAVFLAEPYPGGAGRPDQAVQLLLKGAAADPKKWEYIEDVGFVYYWWIRDYIQAAEWFKRASDLPGAPSWLAPLAATTLAQGGNRESSRLLWTQLRDQTDIDWIKRNAGHRLQQLDAMDLIDRLNAVVANFMQRRGRPPADWRELAIEQRWREMPVDPVGTPFDLDPVTGRVSLARHSALWPLPEGGVSVDAVPQP